MMQFGESAKTIQPQINFIAEHLGKKTVAELERIATALYVFSEQKASISEAAGEIIRLKPHVSSSQAQAAVDEVTGLSQKAELRALFLGGKRPLTLQ